MFKNGKQADYWLSNSEGIHWTYIYGPPHYGYDEFKFEIVRDNGTVFSEAQSIWCRSKKIFAKFLEASSLVTIGLAYVKPQPQEESGQLLMF